MNVAEQLKRSTKQFTKCFFKDRLLVLRIILFIVFTTSLVWWLLVRATNSEYDLTVLTYLFMVFALASPLWYYLVECVLLFMIRMLQAAGDFLENIIHDEKLPGSVRVAMILVCYPIIALRYVTLPMLNIPFWVVHFFFNVFSFVTSLGKSGWSDIVTARESKLNIELSNDMDENKLVAVEANTNSNEPSKPIEVEKQTSQIERYTCKNAEIIIEKDNFKYLIDGTQKIEGKVKIKRNQVLLVSQKGTMTLTKVDDGLQAVSGLVYKKVASN